MVQLAEHPTVKQFHARETPCDGSARPQSLDREWLRQVCLEAGADDVGLVEIDRAEIADQTEFLTHITTPKAWRLLL